MASVFLKRFQELEVQFEQIRSTRVPAPQGNFSLSGFIVDSNEVLNWAVKVKNLLMQIGGETSIYFKQFVHAEVPGSWRDTYTILLGLGAIFRAAKEDFEGGYLNSVRNLVQAEVFSDELEQARELLSAGYYVAAAVVAGVVLETTLRQLCADRGIPHGKLDRMNSDLTKASCYNMSVQKRITALADIRNNAAHGHPDQFNHQDVKDMISYIGDFVGSYMQ